MNVDSRPTINILQAGRALAALAVVFFHVALAARDFDRMFPGFQILGVGYLGVDFFFVLSGFIIYHSTVDRGRPVTSYAAARIRRVFLPYLPVGVGLAVLYTLLPHISRGDVKWSWLPTLTLLPVDASPALVVAWTLQHEMFFYVIFGLFYYGGVLWLGLGIWTLAVIFGPNDTIPLALINLEFLMGIGAAWLYRRDIAHPALWLVAVAALGIWVFLGAQREQSVLVGLACAAAILPLARIERQEKLRVPSWLVLLGAASYALYLVHSLAISIVARLVPGLWFVIIPAGVAGSLMAGLGYYWLVERKLLTLFGGKFMFRSTRNPPRAAGTP